MLSIVVAYATVNRGIGYRGALPWRLPSDLRRFRELTIGGTVLMGRKTFQSLPDAYRPLPGRRNIVVSASADFDPAASNPGAATEPAATAEPYPGGDPLTSVEVHRSIEGALQACGTDCFVIGGGSIYAQTLPFARRVYATEVEASPPSDTFFPELPPRQWRCSERSEMLLENGHSFAFATYDRID